MHSDRSTGKRRRGGARWLLFGCGGLFAAFLAAGFGYLAWANAPLPPLDPDPPLPSPNGRDVCVAALANRPLPAGKSPLDNPDRSLLPQIRQALAKPDPAAEKVRAALTLEYRNPANYDLNATFPEVAHYRPLAKRWTAEARLARTEGDPSAAIAHCLDAIELGGRIPHGGGLLHHLVGVACQSIPLHQAEMCVPELPAEAARRAGQRLDRIVERMPPASEFIEVERRAGLSWVRAFFRGQGRGLGITGASSSALSHPLVLALYPKPWTYQNMDTYYRACLEELKKPYPSRGQPEVPRDVFCAMLLPAFSGPSDRLTERDAALNLLRLELALHEYRAAHGKFPAALKQLAPTYLDRIPPDPFTEKPFPYQRKGSGYLLYSLGYDGRDDGGTPIANRKTSSNGPGDLVAGKLWPGY